jgi:hypothetical protein
MWHDQPQGKSVIRRKGLAIVVRREQNTFAV